MNKQQTWLIPAFIGEILPGVKQENFSGNPVNPGKFRFPGKSPNLIG